MNERQHAWLSLMAHTLLAVPCFAFGGYQLTAAYHDLGAVRPLLLGMGLLLAGSVLIARPVARLLARPWGALYFPDEPYARPPPRYSIAEARVKEGRYAEALAMYEKIAADYPDEIKPHLAMLELAVRRLHDPVRATAIYHRSRAALRQPAQRAVLARMRQALLVGHEPPPAATATAPSGDASPPQPEKQNDADTGSSGGGTIIKIYPAG